MRRFHRLLFEADIQRGYQRLHEYRLPETTAPYWKLNEARPFQGDLVAKTTLTVTSGKPVDLLNSPLSWLVVSTRLLAAWQAFENELEVFAANVTDPNGAPLSGYHVVNLLRAIQCVDVDRSDVQWGNKKRRRAQWVTTAVIDSQAVPADAHLFRLAESRDYIVCSDELAQSLVGLGLQGLVFERLDSA